MSLAGKVVKIAKLGTHGRCAEIELPGDPPVTVQWGADWFLVSRDDGDDQHVVGFSVEQVRDLIPITRTPQRLLPTSRRTAASHWKICRKS